MSTMTVKALWPNEKQEDLKEFRNSHGGALLLWDVISQRYLGLAPFAYFLQIDKLWPLSEDVSIPLHHRAVLKMTYDRCYLSKENYAQAARDIRACLADLILSQEGVNHWPALAELLESEPDCPAIGFHWTSVSENPFDGAFNDETEEYALLDWYTAWELYENLVKAH